MSDRYEILDILSQDQHGVVFKATDRRNDATVVLRRFFPFGSGGGGLQAEEKQAYEIALRRLADVRHPALRRVLDGGTDPVDGLPFLVTEWQEGTSLARVLGQLEHPVATARLVAITALEASLLLSEVFQEEALWLETTAETIILPHDGSMPGVTFWICPIRWLGDPDHRRTLEPLVELVEQVAGWKGQIISDTAGNGLGRWVNTLRKSPGVWSVAEAHQALRATSTAAPSAAAPPSPAPSVGPPRPAAKVTRPKTKSNPWPWVVAILLTLATGAFVYLQSQRGQAPPLPPVASPAIPTPDTPAAPREVTPEEIATAVEKEAGEAFEKPAGPGVETVEALAAKLAAERAAAETFAVGTSYPLEGEVVETDVSSSGKTIYAKIRTDQGAERWIGFRISQVALFTPDSIGGLRSKRVKVNGEFQTERSNRGEIFFVRHASDFAQLAP